MLCPMPSLVPEYEDNDREHEATDLTPAVSGAGSVGSVNDYVFYPAYFKQKPYS